MKRETLRKLNIPNKPGVYFFLKGKEIVYIGKATSLGSRVKSYFSKDLIATRGPLLVDMVFRADKIDWQSTDNVLEALILEATLIKKHQPRYNTKEKSDKSFNYVVITRPARNASGIADAGGEKLPRVAIVRGKNLDESEFKNVYGPYTNPTQLREALRIIRRIFPFLDEKSKNYLEFYQQINLAPNTGDRSMYLDNINNIKLFFAGKKKKIRQNLKKQMISYAKNREFEKANEIKRQIFALQHINDIALLKNEDFVGKSFSQVLGKNPQTVRKTSADFVMRIEAYDIAHMSGKNMVGVMTVVENNVANKSEYRKFKIRTQNNANDTGALEEVLKRRFNHTEWNFPNLIVVDGGVAQINAAEKLLKNLQIQIPVASVVKDNRHKPKAIKGRGELVLDHKNSILLANSEAHRFAITYHKNMRAKNFLK